MQLPFKNNYVLHLKFEVFFFAKNIIALIS